MSISHTPNGELSATPNEMDLTKMSSKGKGQMEKSQKDKVASSDNPSSVVTSNAGIIKEAFTETVKNTLDVSGFVSQVEVLADQSQHEETMSMIRNDTTLSIKEKLRLLNREEKRHDKRVRHSSKIVFGSQTSQMGKVIVIIAASGAAVGLCISGVVLALQLSDPSSTEKLFKSLQTIFDEEISLPQKKAA